MNSFLWAFSLNRLNILSPSEELPFPVIFTLTGVDTVYAHCLCLLNYGDMIQLLSFSPQFLSEGSLPHYATFLFAIISQELFHTVIGTSKAPHDVGSGLAPIIS